MVARNILLVATLSTAASLRADIRLWTGAGGDNEWTNTLNWSDSAVPGSGDTAVFENAAPLGLRIDRPSGCSVGATHFRFLGADVTIWAENADEPFYIYGSGTSVVEVVAGTTVTCSNYLFMYHGDNLALAKRGGGTFRNVYRNNYIDNLKKLTVEGGSMERAFLSDPGHILPPTASVHVGEGADYLSSGYTSFSSNGGGLILDGGRFTAGLGGVSYWWSFGSSDNRRPDVEVGEGGGIFRAVDYGSCYSDNGVIRMYGAFKPATGVLKDGGATIDLRDCGVGFMPLAPFSTSGPVTFRDGRLLLARYGDSEYADIAANPSFFGTGDFELDCSVLDYTAMSDSDLPEDTLRLAPGVGSRMTVRGSSEVRFRADSAKNPQHIVAGPDDAAANSAFVRERGGALFLFDAGAAFDGSASTLKVNGGVATNESTTLVKAPVFIDKPVNDVDTSFFLCYDEEKGFVEFPEEGYGDSLSAGPNVVVRGSNVNGLSLADNADAHVAAVQLTHWGEMTLNPGSRLTVGNGVDPACVLMGYATVISGSGTLDFGASEGVVVVGVAGDISGHGISCSFSGSGGVSFVARPAFGRRVAVLTGASDYTGVTHVSAAAIRVRHELAFSTGDVHVDGGYRNGGKLMFDVPLTLANNLHVSGGGHRLNQWRDDDDTYGAISFEADGVVLAGDVELTARTEVAAASGARGTFSGVVSGDRLVVMPGEGRVILAANNTYTGGTEIVSAKVTLAGASPSLGSGRVSLDNGSVRFENSAPVSFANSVEGTGKFEIEGADVTFAVPQIRNGSPTTLARGSEVEFADGVARIIYPGGFTIIIR